MARIPDAFIDKLLARTDIVEVVGSRLPLKRQGKEYASRCPFHDERSASFYVSPTKQFYHCFGCGAHGTAINFLMNYDRLEFLDAVDELAKRAGMEIPRETQQKHAHQDDSRPLYAALEAASHFFQKHLENNPKVQAYLNERGVDINTRTRFQIGYAPDGYSVLKDTLGTDERRITLLDRAGMLSKNDRDHVYDKFRDRVMFPIFDRRGRVIAFGGRVLDKDKKPEIPQLPGNHLISQKPRTVRPLASTPSTPEHRTTDRRRRLHGCDLTLPIWHHPSRCHTWHSNHRRTRRTPISQYPGRVLLL